MPWALWYQRPVPPPDVHRRLGLASPLLARLLWHRGVRDAAAAARFLAPEAQPLGDPWTMRGVGDAVRAVHAALDAGMPIGIHGDYDCDGVSAAAVLADALERLGATVEVYIPHRVRDGYGVAADALRRFAARGVRLVLTVDCGITANAEVALAGELGLTVIVTDHHHVPVTLPAARAVLNPRQPGCGYPFRDLAGAGVAFVLARALLHSRLPPVAAEEAATALLDLVALGTIADLVPLVGENRTLVARGLRVLNAAPRPGLRLLLQVAGLAPGVLTAQQIAFGLTTRLNAAGRMGDATEALRLLRAPDLQTAAPLATALQAANRARQEAVEAATVEASTRLDPAAPAHVIAGPFPLGVVGLVASRLAERTGRPCLVLERDGEHCRGSARGPEGFHLAEALSACGDLLLKYGGHAQAGGCTLRAEHLPALTARFQALARAALGDTPAPPRLGVEDTLALSALDWPLAESLRALEPCGLGNPPPLFYTPRVRVREARPLGRTGTALRLGNGGPSVRAAWFGPGAPPEPGEWIDIVYEVERREWEGQVRLDLRLRDWRAAAASPLPAAPETGA
ncbi:MAG: single-stranded-DNA-specific exonuclease RecJ [Chloroflexi bacterium]|nr:single-stranded-DNA-specific exonuclease RecJ [Chloroflexota bacterium]